MDHQLTLTEDLAVAPRLRGEVDLDANVRIEHWRGGHLLDVREGHNLITDAGKAGVAGLINGISTNFFESIAIGTGTVAAAVGDTALGAEITTAGGARGAGTTSQQTTTVTNDTAQVQLLFTFTGSFAVTESGLLNVPTTGGTLLARQVFSALNVVSGDSLTITWKVKAS